MGNSTTSQDDSCQNPSTSNHHGAEQNEREEEPESSMTEPAPIDEEDPIVTAEAVDVACSIVKSCLAQICMYYQYESNLFVLIFISTGPFFVTTAKVFNCNL